MRKARICVIGALAVAVLAAALIAPATRLRGGDSVPKTVAERSVPSGRLVVHEWGTFTNFAGADGVQLEFRPLVDNELPPFVFDRARHCSGWFGKLGLVAKQRMETPVTYFYTDHPQDVSVRVRFPEGLLTEFYPPVKALGPRFAPQESLPLGNSYLDWGKVRIIPTATFQRMQGELPHGLIPPAALPAVEGDNHYAFARETDSAVVEFTDPVQRKHYEKFLFYRGVGNFDLPLRFTARGGGRFAAGNSGPDPISDLFLVHIEREQVWFTRYEALPAQESRSLELPPSPSSVDQLADQMTDALVDAGLYAKEARSMVKTWQSSWFGEEGTRLLYLVPRRLTDKVLPLEISPPPHETIRVLVGRMETLTPERADRLAAAIRQLGTCASCSSELLRNELAPLGRFAEPALTFLAEASQNADCRGQIEVLLAELRNCQTVAR
jgi:hypothetical protein